MVEGYHSDKSRYIQKTDRVLRFTEPAWRSKENCSMMKEGAVPSEIYEEGIAC